MKLTFAPAFKSLITEDREVKVVSVSGKGLLIELEKDVQIVVGVEGFKASDVKTGAKLSIAADGEIKTALSDFIKKGAGKAGSSKTGSTPRGASLQAFA